MKQEDKDRYVNRYTERYRTHGYSPVSLGWGKGGRQEYRFMVAMEVGVQPHHSVLDVGCGFADFYRYLAAHGWNGSYVGLDIVDVLLDEARIQNPGIDVRNVDILSDSFSGCFDYVVSSGAFNARLTGGDNYSHIERMLCRMFELSRIAVVSDFMTSYVDFQNEIAFHAEPERIFSIARKISRRIALRHDYMPYEFAAYLFKDDAIDVTKSLFIGSGTVPDDATG